MSKSLVSVESPAKAKTSNKILGKDFVVKSCMGHGRHLPPRELGLDIEDDFRPCYVTIRGKGRILTELRQAAHAAEAIYLATDPDRQGEAITWHVTHAARRVSGCGGQLVEKRSRRGKVVYGCDAYPACR